VIEDALFYAVIPGVIGARLWHVFTDWHLYQNNPIEALFIWQGGLGIYGAILGGILGAYLYCRKKQLPFLKILDIVSLFLPLAQVVGRFGNLVNQEIYGSKTDLPWGFYVQAQQGYYHPAFLYEQVGNMVLFCLLYRLYQRYYLKRKSAKSGLLTLLYFSGYAIVRFLVDFFRTEPRIYLGMTFAQFFSLAVLLVAGMLLFLKYRNNKLSKNN